MGALLCAGFGGCGDDECGPAGAPDSGIVASNADVTLTYGNMTAGLNNDCPFRSPPQDGDVVSLTIQGMQTDGTGFFTLCVERPDKLNGALALGVDTQGSPVHVNDLTGTANNCTFKFLRTLPIAGTATGSGVCANGDDPAGFALVIDGTATLERTCNTTVDTVDVELRGRVAVAKQ